LNNETKRDVLVNAVDALADAQASSDNNVGLGHQDADLFMAEYEKALPDDLPVIPKAVGEYIKRWKDDLLTEPLFVIFLTIQHNINIDNPPDLKVENWIIDHSDTFARAWLLGAWRVEETGEIVKLEEKK